MSQSPSITVVMCTTDTLAISALAEARRMGLRMPQELSVTRFDDIEITSQFDPPFDNYQRASCGYRPDRCRLPAQRLYGIDQAPRGSLALPA
ncbi:MAG: substrate-binding domain-containing protein [Pseudolabrys sp.]